MTPCFGGTMERKRTMAFSNSHRSVPVAPAASGTPACASRSFAEGGHQLEKLEFALAVAITRGDASRVRQLRDQIAALGGNREEPGT
jgi:hypothetical protein